MRAIASQSVHARSGMGERAAVLGALVACGPAPAANTPGSATPKPGARCGGAGVTSHPPRFTLNGPKRCSLSLAKDPRMPYLRPVSPAHPKTRIGSLPCRFLSPSAHSHSSSERLVSLVSLCNATRVAGSPRLPSTRPVRLPPRATKSPVTRVPCPPKARWSATTTTCSKHRFRVVSACTIVSPSPLPGSPATTASLWSSTKRRRVWSSVWTTAPASAKWTPPRAATSTPLTSSTSPRAAASSPPSRVAALSSARTASPCIPVGA